jgi:phospholipase/carboxylesterase
MAKSVSPLESIVIETGPDPVATVIVLHGLGADGNDFVPVAEQLQLERVGAVRFIFPHAPTRPVTINNGYVMRAWYDIRNSDLVRREDEEGLRESQAQIEAILAGENEKGIANSRIVLAGFSQGCAMTLMTGIRQAEPLAGLVAMSGYLPLADLAHAERNAASSGVPIFMAHGMMDPVVPIARAVQSREVLEKLGYSVEWHQYPMPHSVCQEEIVDLNRFLLQVLSTSSEA